MKLFYHLEQQYKKFKSKIFIVYNKNYILVLFHLVKSIMYKYCRLIFSDGKIGNFAKEK